jgi:hypothetical protein
MATLYGEMAEKVGHVGQVFGHGNMAELLRNFPVPSNQAIDSGIRVSFM